ncbi:MAG: nicotinate-nucleotide--dimethylbenzimidazole phosphoribosyltransferase [Lachnospiraceae bacterium]|nr:nicotinate-nucleotide--dimethylbenzimidazole phosphoribosyltransferase [Lachnospiraceae bacterium]MDY5742197.1 nicotinate-nucleotide--dimethylbenzimidazole phosphoribosyltransferase [Lachnospiraceae bacterium]
MKEATERQPWEALTAAYSKETERACIDFWNQIGKPIGGLGLFETQVAQLAGITGTVKPQLSKVCHVVCCADNGIIEEGVTQTGQQVTAIVAENMQRGLSSAALMCRDLGVEMLPIDVGVAVSTSLRQAKERFGSRNFLREPAMTEAEARHLIAYGMQLVGELKEAGYQAITVGEMGIGNTTTAAAVCAALLNLPAEQVTGRGAGLSDAGLQRKIAVIGQAISKYNLYQADAFTVLCHVGGYDIAALTGLCLGAMRYHMPVILDGAITCAAALIAERLVPGCRDFVLASHNGKEQGIAPMLAALDRKPVIHAELCLGEGTGALLLLAQLRLALTVYHQMGSFAGIGVEQYEVRIKS